MLEGSGGGKDAGKQAMMEDEKKVTGTSSSLLREDLLGSDFVEEVLGELGGQDEHVMDAGQFDGFDNGPEVVEISTLSPTDYKAKHYDGGSEQTGGDGSLVVGSDEEEEAEDDTTAGNENASYGVVGITDVTVGEVRVDEKLKAEVRGLMDSVLHDDDANTSSNNNSDGLKKKGKSEKSKKCSSFDCFSPILIVHFLFLEVNDKEVRTKCSLSLSLIFHIICTYIFSFSLSVCKVSQKGYQ